MSGFQIPSSVASDLAMKPAEEAVQARVGSGYRRGSSSRGLCQALVLWEQLCKGPWWLEVVEGGLR